MLFRSWWLCILFARGLRTCDNRGEICDKLVQHSAELIAICSSYYSTFFNLLFVKVTHLNIWNTHAYPHIRREVPLKKWQKKMQLLSNFVSKKPGILESDWKERKYLSGYLADCQIILPSFLISVFFLYVYLTNRCHFAVVWFSYRCTDDVTYMFLSRCDVHCASITEQTTGKWNLFQCFIQ